jgi:hypothetical protein
LSSGKSKESYLATAKKILGSDFELPIAATDGGGGVVSQKYGMLTDSQIEELMGCFVEIALCERKVEHVVEVGVWISFHVELGVVGLTWFVLFPGVALAGGGANFVSECSDSSSRQTIWYVLLIIKILILFSFTAPLRLGRLVPRQRRDFCTIRSCPRGFLRHISLLRKYRLSRAQEMDCAKYDTRIARTKKTGDFA